jgi:hypothetical protein
VLIYACIQASIITSLDSIFCLKMYTCSYSSNPIYLPFDASPSEHVNIFYFTVNYRDFANYRFRKLQISQTADFANYRFRKLQISQITDFANCRFRKLQISFRFVSFRFVNYSKPLSNYTRTIIFTDNHLAFGE